MATGAIDDAKYVLDASVIIAYVLGEPGGRIDQLLPFSAVSTVNWAEVVQKLPGTAFTQPDGYRDLEELGVRFIPFTIYQATRAGNLIAMTKTLGLSLGDRACLSLGLELAATVLTVDSAWSGLRLGIEIRVLR